MEENGLGIEIVDNNGNKHKKTLNATVIFVSIVLVIAVLAGMVFWLKTKKISSGETKIAETNDIDNGNIVNLKETEEQDMDNIVQRKVGECLNEEDLINGICVKKINCANVSCDSSQDCANGKCVQGKDLISFLDSYESLSRVKSKLLSMKVTDKNTKSETNGYEVLKKLINEKRYNPQIYITKSNFLKDFFTNYNLPQTGSELFLINIAGGLWTEAYGNFGWSLKDYNQNEIDGLFIQNDSLNDNNPDSLVGRPLVPNMPHTELQLSLYLPSQIVEDAHFKQYNLAMKLVNGSKNQKEAVENVLLWGEKNFFHPIDEPGNSWTWGVYLDGRSVVSKNISPETSFPLSIERIYDERAIGCQEPTVLLEGILHNLNIPAVRLWVWRHGVLYLPTLDAYIHGDSVVGGKWPKGMWLLSPERLRPTALVEAEFLRPMAKTYDLKYPFALGMQRKNKELYITIGPLFVYPQKTCIGVTENQWKEITKDFSEYDLNYNKENCMVEGKSQPILSLDQLND